MIYNKEMLKIYTSTELNKFGKRYHDILVETGKGTVTEDRTTGTITDNRTKEQINLVNKIVTSMLPVLERIASNLKTVGRYGEYPFNLRGIEVKRVRTPIADAVNEGARCVINHFHTYNPNRSNEGGSVYNFVVFQAGSGMAMYMLKDIPNSATVLNKIRTRTLKGLPKDKVFDNLPYIYPVSLTEILDGVEDGTRNMVLERRYLTSDSNPEKEVISKITGEHIPKVVEDLLSTLDPRERKILERRKGLNGYEKTGLRELEKMFRITGERVRQIEVKAINKLKKRRPKELVELVR